MERLLSSWGGCLQTLHHLVSPHSAVAIIHSEGQSADICPHEAPSVPCGSLREDYHEVADLLNHVTTLGPLLTVVNAHVRRWRGQWTSWRCWTAPRWCSARRASASRCLGRCCTPAGPRYGAPHSVSPYTVLSRIHLADLNCEQGEVRPDVREADMPPEGLAQLLPGCHHDGSHSACLSQL